MCPSLINDFVEVLLTTVAAYLEGDGSPVRKLFLQRLSDVEHLKVFHLLVKAFNITPDEVRDSQIFAECGSLELMKYLATTYGISKADAIQAFYRCFQQHCTRGSFEIAVWLSEQFQLTKDDLFTRKRRCYTVLAACRTDEALKWLVERYQISLADMGYSPLWQICERNHSLELIRWLSSTYDFERDDVLKAFFNVCVDGPLEIAQFLTERYKLTADEIRGDNRILKYCNDLTVRAWLLDNYYTSQN